jgi:hypothetical protein
VKYFCSKTNEMHQFLKFILFWSRILHVSDGLSVHYQESKTVRTASGIYQTDSADCLLAGTRWNWGHKHAVRVSRCIVWISEQTAIISLYSINPLNAELNPICYLLALLEAHHFLHVSRIRVKSLTLRLLISYVNGAPILDVSRSHTTTQHSR